MCWSRSSVPLMLCFVPTTARPSTSSSGTCSYTLAPCEACQQHLFQENIIDTHQQNPEAQSACWTVCSHTKCILSFLCSTTGEEVINKVALENRHAGRDREEIKLADLQAAVAQTAYNNSTSNCLVIYLWNIQSSAENGYRRGDYFASFKSPTKWILYIL